LQGISTREVMCVESVFNTVLPNDQACSDHNLAQPEREKECYNRDCPGDPSLEYPDHGGMNDMGKDVNNAVYMWRTGPWGEVSHITIYSFVRIDVFMAVRITMMLWILAPYRFVGRCQRFRET
jgi:hypothetical protein